MLGFYIVAIVCNDQFQSELFCELRHPLQYFLLGINSEMVLNFQIEVIAKDVFVLSDHLTRHVHVISGNIAGNHSSGARGGGNKSLIILA